MWQTIHEYYWILGPLIPGALALWNRQKLRQLWTIIGDYNALKKNLATCESERDYLFRALAGITEAAEMIAKANNKSQEK